MLANIDSRKKTASTIMPVITTTSAEICIAPPLELLLGQFLPTTYIRDAPLKPGHHDFGIARNRRSIFAASRRGAPCAVAQINQLTGPLFANRAGHFPKHPDHVVIGRIERPVMRGKLQQKP